MELAIAIVIGILALWFLERQIGRSLDAYDLALPQVEERVVEEVDGHLKEILDRLEEFAENRDIDIEDEAFGRQEIAGSIRFDLFRLFAYLSAWNGVVTPKELALIKSVIGYALYETDILSIAEEMDKGMGEDGYFYSSLCFRLARIDPEMARWYLEKLTEIGRIFLRETGDGDAGTALDYFRLMGRISIEADRWILRRINLTESASVSTRDIAV
jgi:hypothetical protein